MIRRIITIDESRCNGCGLCVKACHEGAIGIVDGKAKLMREDYCDGLGDCLPACPMDAISFEEREAPAYDEAAVLEAKRGHAQETACCQTKMKPEDTGCDGKEAVGSCLNNFPVQIRLAPTNSPQFDGAHLLIAADCAAYAYGSFHQDFIRGRVTLIGCPKLDFVDYSQKLTQILQECDIRSVTVARMTVPCCSGLANAVKRAAEKCGKTIPVRVVLIGPDGRLSE